MQQEPNPCFRLESVEVGKRVNYRLGRMHVRHMPLRNSTHLASQIERPPQPCRHQGQFTNIGQDTDYTAITSIESADLLLHWTPQDLNDSGLPTQPLPYDNIKSYLRKPCVFPLISLCGTYN